MRVLYLNPFSQQVSGPDESLLTLLGALIPMGVEAHLVLPRLGPQVPRYESLGVKVHYAPLTVLRRRPGLEALLLPFRFARGVAAVARIARRERVDIIHSNMEVVLDGAIASRLLRIPHVMHYRGNTNDDPKLVFDVLTRFWTATAEKIICISNATAEIFRKRGLGAKVEVVYNPVDVEVFAGAERSDEVRRELGAAPGELLVGTVGRIHPRKDMATFLRAGALAAKEVPNLKLVVVGTAEAREEVRSHAELRALARELGIEDQLTWAGARRDMPRVLKALDVFVLCSRNEGFGRVVAEAIAARTPMVVTREGALLELVGNDKYAATAADAEDFARQIVQRLGSPIEGTAGQAAHFDTARIGTVVEETYRAIQDPPAWPIRLPPRPSPPSSVYDQDYYLRCCEGAAAYHETAGTVLTEPRKRALDVARGRIVGARVLDLGCGRGELMLAAAQNGAASVFGVDFSADAVALTADTCARDESRNTLGPTAVIRADVRDLPFSSLSFDVAFSTDVIEHLVPREADRMLAEAYRVLRPGGLLVLHTFPNRWWQRFGYYIFYALSPTHRHRYGTLDAARATADSTHVNEQSPLSLARALRFAGFRPVVWTDDFDFAPRSPLKRRVLKFLTATWPMRLFCANHLFAEAQRGADSPARR